MRGGNRWRGVIMYGYIAGHTIKIIEHAFVDPAVRPGASHESPVVEHAYSITGGKWSMGSLFSSAHTPDQLWEAAVGRARSRHPRARLYGPYTDPAAR